MPIRGLTDTARPVFPSLGKLRKGAERTDEDKARNRPGKELDHFRFTSDRPEIERTFENHPDLGSTPREIDVVLPYASIEDCFSTWQEAWKAGGLQHRCDGEVCTIWLQPDGNYSREPIACPGGCDPVGRLCVIIPALIRAGFVGFVTMETHSLHDILAIQGSLLATVQVIGHEDLRGIGFVLRRVEEQISTPGQNGKRVRRKKWMVKLEPIASWLSARLNELQAPPELIESNEMVNTETGEIESRIPSEPQWEKLLDKVAKETNMSFEDIEAVIGKPVAYRGMTEQAIGKKVRLLIDAHIKERIALENEEVLANAREEEQFEIPM